MNANHNDANVSFLFCRYSAVTKPFSYDEQKVRRRLPLVFFGSWVVAFLVETPSYVLDEMRDGDCITLFYESEQTGMAVFLFWVFALLIIPASIMIILYVKMFLVFSRNFDLGDSR